MYPGGWPLTHRDLPEQDVFGQGVVSYQVDKMFLSGSHEKPLRETGSMYIVGFKSPSF